MKCYVCDQEDWHALRGVHPSALLQVCKSCGNVAIDVGPADAAAMEAYYRSEYRRAPVAKNIVQAFSKRYMISGFMAEFLAGKRGLKCLDIGAGTGFWPAWLVSQGHDAGGVELALGFRRFAHHYYGLDLAERIDPEQRYDLISLWHVLEHLTEPDQRLQGYVDSLAPGGRLLVSVPEWFRYVAMAGYGPVTDFAGYFAKDHINVFSGQSLKNLFAKVGLVIEKEDHVIQGQTYLLRPVSDGEPVPERVAEDWQAQVERVMTIKGAIIAHRDGRSRDAVDLWPAFPEPWLALIDTHKGNPQAKAELYTECEPFVGDHMLYRWSRAQWHFWNERYEQAAEDARWVCSRSPQGGVVRLLVELEVKHLGRPQAALKYLRMLMDLDPDAFSKHIDLFIRLAAKAPFAGE